MLCQSKRVLRNQSLYEEIKPEKKREEETNYSQAEPKSQHPKIKHLTHTNPQPNSKNLPRTNYNLSKNSKTLTTQIHRPQPSRIHKTKSHQTISSKKYITLFKLKHLAQVTKHKGRTHQAKTHDTIAMAESTSLHQPLVLPNCIEGPSLGASLLLKSNQTSQLETFIFFKNPLRTKNKRKAEPLKSMNFQEN